MEKNKKSDNPNVTDPLKKWQIECTMAVTKHTDLMRDVMSDKQFEEFKRRCNQKGIE